MPQYRKIQIPSEAFKNEAGNIIPRWILDRVKTVRQVPASLTLDILCLDNTTTITVNGGEWFVYDGDSNTVLKMTDVAFLAAYEPIP
jgi:hypothetical protein